MSGYVLGHDAELDLENIWEHIAEDDIEAADRWIERLFEAFEKLSRTPGMGTNGMTSLNIRFYSGRRAPI